MIAKRLRDGRIAYYWNPHVRYIRAGFPLHREPLGQDYGTAIKRAAELNRHLDDWRRGRDTVKDLDLQPGFGTLDWLVQRYKNSNAWDEVSARSRYEYDRALDLVLRYRRTTGAELGSAPLATISARGVDKLYRKLQVGTRVAKRLRQANVCMLRMAKAWDVVRRLYPKVVPSDNPFRGVGLKHGKATAQAASRAEAYALHAALIAAGEPHLAAVPLICFEWHQRPENVLAGHLTWADYRPAERPNAVRVVHHKTGEVVWLPLAARTGEQLFPELAGYLDTLERLGVPILLMQPKPRGKQIPGPAKPFLLRTARARVRRAAKKAGLPEWLTLAACRHGGLTELGDAELTEPGIIALSGHRTADAARGYVKRTEVQRESGLLKRRAWVEVRKVGDETASMAQPNALGGQGANK
jgi:hypothetical protein